MAAAELGVKASWPFRGSPPEAVMAARPSSYLAVAAGDSVVGDEGDGVLGREGHVVEHGGPHARLEGRRALWPLLSSMDATWRIGREQSVRGAAMDAG